MSVAVEIEFMPDELTRKLIEHGLDEFNGTKAGSDNSEDLWVIARDAAGDVRGGLKARSHYSWMSIDWLWVSESSRGSGLGNELMNKAEAVARECECVGAYVSTYSFQAPDFYRSRGYEEFGRIDGFPPGHACIWLRKTFSEC
ncbi:MULTISPECIES: GNAT family N-acetyltransferase [unclassified Rhizobium]|uniref:GNAT family N-acetyltransferase n=1 Tax=unclassified Rhizobium TaxID=2613769 RepID=UPI001FD09041|nr:MULTISPECIES: GNAT family N-acetyltransferase [unclassified Rhizobium]